MIMRTIVFVFGLSVFWFMAWDLVGIDLRATEIIFSAIAINCVAWTTVGRNR